MCAHLKRPHAGVVHHMLLAALRVPQLVLLIGLVPVQGSSPSLQGSIVVMPQHVLHAGWREVPPVEVHAHQQLSPISPEATTWKSGLVTRRFTRWCGYFVRAMHAMPCIWCVLSFWDCMCRAPPRDAQPTGLHAKLWSQRREKFCLVSDRTTRGWRAYCAGLKNSRLACTQARGALGPGMP